MRTARLLSRLTCPNRSRRAGASRVAAGVLLSGGLLAVVPVSSPVLAPGVGRAPLGVRRPPADTVDSLAATENIDSVTAKKFKEPPPVQWTRWDSAGWQGRVVVGEYITGIFCGHCWFHDRTYEALLQRYPASAFIVLGYADESHLPLGSPLAHSWDILRNWYGRQDTVPGQDGLFYSTKGVIPAQPGIESWIDGYAPTDIKFANNEENDAAMLAFYAKMVSAIDAELHKAPEAALRVQVMPHGGTLDTRVTVTRLAPGHPNVFVRINLVEDTVHFQMTKHPGNLRDTYYMTVRDFAGSAQYSLGIPLQGPGTVHYTFDLAKMERAMLHLRGEFRQGGYPQYFLFPDACNWRLNPARLHIVAFVQDAKTGDVLQAQMVPVPPGLQLAGGCRPAQTGK